ncbi:MAG: TonB-dependent receptor, partial [Bacteroidota bacterium]
METIVTKKLILSILSILMMFQINIYSQTTTGSIKGKVQDETGNPVTDAELTIKGYALLGTAVAVTDKNGSFEIFDLPPGEYKMVIRHLTYNTTNYEQVKVLLGKSTYLGEITLNKKNIELEEAVIVWEKPVIDMTSTTIGSNLESKVFETLPSGRDYMSVIALMPQANNSPYGDQVNIAGASGSDNAYYIDGMNITNPYDAASGAYLPFNFVEGIEIKQSGYEAEFGNALGGIINVVTPSGGNKFKIDAFSFYTNDMLKWEKETDLSLAQDIKSYNKYDIGVSLGGPIVKDKFWYFLAYNTIFDNKDIDIQGFGINKDSKLIHAFATKLDWIALKNTRFNFSVVGNLSRHKEAGIGPWGMTLSNIESIDAVLAQKNDESINMVLGIKKRTSKDFFLSAKLYYSYWGNKLSGQTDIGRTEPVLYDWVNNSMLGGYGMIDNYKNERKGIKISVARNWNKHNVKSGIEIELLSWDIIETVLTEPGQIDKYAENYFQVMTYAPEGSVKKTLPTFYIQDRWNLLEKLAINLGLRWDVQ